MNIRLTDLTPRERQIVKLVTRGLTNEAIADELGIATATVKNILLSAMHRVGVAGFKHMNPRVSLIHALFHITPKS